MRALLAAILLFAPPALAGGPFFVSPFGSDANPCSSVAPCLTVQHAVDIAPVGYSSTINLAAGAYAAANITYYKMIVLTGDCSHWDQVTLTGDTAIWVQDHAIAQVSCLSITGSRIGIASRQFAIVDVANVRFGAGTRAILANEMSKINVCGIELVGAVSYVLSAGSQSQIDASCFVHVLTPMTVADFAWVAWQSQIDGSGLTFTGASSVSGPQYFNDSSLLFPPPGGFPGTVAGTVAHGGIIE